MTRCNLYLHGNSHMPNHINVNHMPSSIWWSPRFIFFLSVVWSLMESFWEESNHLASDATEEGCCYDCMGKCLLAN